MPLNMEFYTGILLALIMSMLISFGMTPLIKIFANKVGAIDNPGEERRVHAHPIPRMGGLAIFLGFILSVVLFGEITEQVRGILLGAIVIVIVGVIDDIISLRAYVKFLFQIGAAVIAVAHGVVAEVIMNPNLFSANEYLPLGVLSIPLTIIWIVAVTNSVNLIDGLDGLAVGVSAIDSVMMLVIALALGENVAAVVLAALTGACVGFMPYNLNPAKIFMGDCGALLLGYVLSTVSVLGLFKMYAVISFVVPFLILAVPILDTAFAFSRRILKGKNPMAPDRGHFHHKLLDMGLSQKHVVAILYVISAILGLAAVMLTTTGESKILIVVIAFVASGAVGAYILHMKAKLNGNGAEAPDKPESEVGEENLEKD